MDKILSGILLALLIIFIFVIVFGLQGLILWCVGAFICYAFSIPFHFTFLHGLAIAFIISILENILTIRRIKEK